MGKVLISNTVLRADFIKKVRFAPGCEGDRGLSMDKTGEKGIPGRRRAVQKPG
jgi:hypothetical protein